MIGNNTPRGERLHIAFFGKRNSGKSSLINAVTKQETALVSEYAGTTTDPVYKSIELHPLGSCVLIDTAGFDDEGALGEMRVEKTRQVVEKADIAVMLFTDTRTEQEAQWLTLFKERNIPVIAAVSKKDVLSDAAAVAEHIKNRFRMDALLLSVKEPETVEQLTEALVAAMPEAFAANSITAHLIQENDIVLLVMPQDIQAPKGRLILPQVQTIRDLLDNQCVAISVTADKLDMALNALQEPPKLIVTDSQIFREVYEKKPAQSMLTSFSVLLARYKGDIHAYLEGAQAVDKLGKKARILIAEACTHRPLSEDIGTVKIPRLLRKKLGEDIEIDMVSGGDFPKDLTGYDLIIQCGACMFNRRYVLSRIARAKEQGVPITNYGIFLAKISGILEKIDI